MLSPSFTRELSEQIGDPLAECFAGVAILRPQLDDCLTLAADGDLDLNNQVLAGEGTFRHDCLCMQLLPDGAQIRAPVFAHGNVVHVEEGKTLLAPCVLASGSHSQAPSLECLLAEQRVPWRTCTVDRSSLRERQQIIYKALLMSIIFVLSHCTCRRMPCLRHTHSAMTIVIPWPLQSRPPSYGSSSLPAYRGS